MTIVEVWELQKRIEELFAENGQYVCFDFHDYEDNIEKAFAEHGFTPDETKRLIKAFVCEGDTGFEVNIQQIIEELCDMYDFSCEIWLDCVFESCGLDVYVLSFHLRDGDCHDTYSMHNVYYWD